MAEHRIILADGSRLLREMLKRIFEKSDDLEVVGEVTDIKNLPHLIREKKAQWVILSTPPEESVPRWIETIISEQPEVRFLSVSNDGSEIKIKWYEPHEKIIKGLSLQDLITILQAELFPLEKYSEL
jgi:DNA-binding NarL/FixJ family response regulator